ncbi:hypothetical protein HY488_00685 [Candidatus Woesearchaeota archaeon]|nr:hypothetical protein [Candidatus Woesearchaeota archaeon]
MATILDVGVLANFSIVFAMVLIIAIVYGILQFTKAFHGTKGLHILIAFIVGLLFILTPDVTRAVSIMIPWFTLLFIFIVFLLMAYKIFGATDADIVGVLRTDRTIAWVIVIIAIVIAIGSFSSVYGQRFLAETVPGAPVEPSGAPTGAVAGVTPSAATPSFSGNLAATFFHPKILGMLFLFLVAVFTIAVLAMEARSVGGGGLGGH